MKCIDCKVNEAVKNGVYCPSCYEVDRRTGQQWRETDNEEDKVYCSVCDGYYLQHKHDSEASV